MESRLKADVLREAASRDGKLLVAREVMGSDEGASASIVDNFVPINGATQKLLPPYVAKRSSFCSARAWWPHLPAVGPSVHAFPPICAGPDDVQTPREVYEALSAVGYKVEYHRVPITDGSSPREHLFDLFYQGVRLAGPVAPVIFNCQMGAGRTTTGMVIASLVRTYEFGKAHSQQAQHTCTRGRLASMHAG